ncbi:ShK domain containing protein [Trichuris trichiura]|uniref:ShK domain containing protein n=1 Tax=Trichuris trichiura TaxID=36087 RepID=A0A077YWX5_TRITR|nr:ShK domain containing protein [Trichuris trichiura]
MLVINDTTTNIPNGMLNNVVSEDNDLSREIMDAEVLKPHETVNISNEGSDIGETTLDEGSGQMEFVGGPSVGSAPNTEEVNAEVSANEEQLVALTTRRAETDTSVGTASSNSFHSALSSNNDEKNVRLTTLLPRPTDSATQSTGNNVGVPKLEHCLDGAAFCPFWAMMGECDRNPFWMKPNCQRSCRSCGMTVADVDKIDSPDSMMAEVLQDVLLQLSLMQKKNVKLTELMFRCIPDYYYGQQLSSSNVDDR